MIVYCSTRVLLEGLFQRKRCGSKKKCDCVLFNSTRVLLQFSSYKSRKELGFMHTITMHHYAPYSLHSLYRINTLFYLEHTIFSSMTRSLKKKELLPPSEMFKYSFNIFCYIDEISLYGSKSNSQKI